ncbi:MAG: serine/threonine protein kinase, partial [Planctomycetota bacterium]
MSSNQLGPYVIERVLGKGGMGVVYAAVHGETGQRAAVKVLAATLSGKTSFRTRFQSEIETLKRLKHPRIVEYYGYGEQDAQLYYAMELVEGASLQDSLKAGRVFTVEEVLH